MTTLPTYRLACASCGHRPPVVIAAVTGQAVTTIDHVRLTCGVCRGQMRFEPELLQCHHPQSPPPPATPHRR